jgi:flagellar operon protein (TIGR03826 family)
MKMNIRNCKECGKLFNFVRRNICPDCIELEEKMFITVRDFLQKNPGTKIEEIAEKTEVPEEKIIYFLREGRITSESLSDNMGLKCESCGGPISKGKICGACVMTLNKEVERFGAKDNKPKEVPQQNANKNKMFTADRSRD